MARREYPATFRCADAGCPERVRYEYETRRDQDEAYRRDAEHPWKCSRHAAPAANLRPGNEATQQVLTASRRKMQWAGGGEEYLSGLFWAEEGKSPAAGFVFGPGFNAYAADFPEGTRLVVNARIELPDAEAGRTGAGQ